MQWSILNISWEGMIWKFKMNPVGYWPEPDGTMNRILCQIVPAGKGSEQIIRGAREREGKRERGWERVRGRGWEKTIERNSSASHCGVEGSSQTLSSLSPLSHLPELACVSRGRGGEEVRGVWVLWRGQGKGLNLHSFVWALECSTAALEADIWRQTE